MILAGCGGSSVGQPDGGPGRGLDIVTPPGAQLGLHYGDAVELRVRYHWNDDQMSAISGARVKFAIFDDPGGSTLASDRGETDSNGVAHVTLTGGMSEASFSVRATAEGAPDALFYVSVSKHDFVDLHVTLAASSDLIALAAEGQALLYTMTSCAQRPPADLPPMPLRQVSAPPGQPLPLVNLLSMDYVIVGRLTNPQGHLIASGCVELPSALAPAGTRAAVPIPLTAAVPSLAGSYAISSTLAWDMTTISAIETPWHKLTACPTSPADLLLDGIEAAAPSFASAIEAQRMAADKGCRPGGSTLDGQLAALLNASGAPGAQLGAIVSALDAQLTAGGALTSTLAVETAGGKLWATHTLGQLTVGKPYDVASLGVPVVTAHDVPIEFPSGGALGSVTIGAHGFTGLGAIERRALDEQTLAVKLPSLMPPTPAGLANGLVAAVVHGGKTGCPGVEDLVCSVTGASGCSGQIAPACVTATKALGDSLEKAFVPADPLDLRLAGGATAVDSDGDLAVDRLAGGVWSGPKGATQSYTNGSFTGTRQ